MAFLLPGKITPPPPPPPPYYEKNNKSALDNLDKLRDQVDAWLAGGFVERLDDRPYCCNPLTVAVQHNAVTDTIKYRPCIDLSRHVNNYIVHSPAKLDDLTIAQQLIAPGDYMCAFDLENQFFQVRLSPDTKKYFGFAVPYPDGTQYFQFTVMAYGCKPAVTVVTRLLKPIKAFLHKLGVKFSVYVDDGRVSAATLAACRSHFCLTLHTLQLAGWKIQWKKTFVHPTQSLLHLGFITDTTSMTYSITADKWANVAAAISLLIAAQDRPVPVRTLAALLGKLVSIRRSHGAIVPALSRHLQHTLALHVNAVGWTGDLRLDSFCKSELASLLHTLPSYNHRPIPSHLSPPHIAPPTPPPPPAAAIAACDPSPPSYQLDITGAITHLPPLVDPTPLLCEIRNATTYIIQHFPLPPLPTILVWPTSHKSFFQAVSHGSLSHHLNSTVITLLHECKMRLITLHPTWHTVPPSHLAASDASFRLSRSTDEWSVSRTDLFIVFNLLHFRPTVDCFATRSNTVCPLFFWPPPHSTLLLELIFLPRHFLPA
jgi:hypothetical protein